MHKKINYPSGYWS